MDLARTIDHTVLKPDSTAAQVDVLCAEAAEYRFASVCILPWHVARAAATLSGTDVAVCTVVGFPLGATTTAMKVAEARDAIDHGASEIDMVASITALKSGDLEACRADIHAVVDACHARGAIVKVIIETCLLTDDEKIRMCEIVTKAGADFIKTSTGFSTGGATLHDVRLLRAHVGPAVRVKASGGIRDHATAVAMVEAGADRIGTSSGVSIVRG
jgi:deoxyribose-phosphate aldolase